MKTNRTKLFTLVGIALVSSLVTLVITLNVTSAGARQPQQFNGNENHVITLDQAVKLVQNYQMSPRVPSIKGGYFGRNIFDKILSQSGCTGVRFYFAQKDDGNSTIVLVGVDNTGNDMTNGILADIVIPCPPYCGIGVLNK